MSNIISKLENTAQYPLEAGGIEPPSRDCFRNASTCVVGRLSLGTASADRQAPVVPSPTVFSLRPGQASFRNQPTGSAARNSGRLPRDGLPVVRQPWHKCCHLRFSPGVLRGLLTTSARHISVHTPGRIHSPPESKYEAQSSMVKVQTTRDHTPIRLFFELRTSNFNFLPCG